jgi:hypothetical protein
LSFVEPKGNDMKPVFKLACPLALAVALALPSAPARAQIAGDQMMSQLAPMIGMMQKKIGKKRLGRLMHTVGPMMAGMQQGGGSGGIGNLSRLSSSLGSLGTFGNLSSISSSGSLGSLGSLSSLGDLGAFGGLGNYGFGGFGDRNAGGGSRY